MKVCCGLIPVCLWRKSRARWKKRARELEEQVRLWSNAASGSIESNGHVAATAWLVVRDLKKELIEAKRTIARLEEELCEQRGMQRGFMALEEKLEMPAEMRKGGAS